MKSNPFVSHLATDQIEQFYRQCRDANEKMHWQVIWMLSQPGAPKSTIAVAKLVGYSPAWAAELLKRWNAHGPDGLVDGRRENGPKPLLTARQQQALLTALQGRVPNRGLWTSPKVARYVEERWVHAIDPSTGWKWLRRLGFPLQVPRPIHPQAASRAERQGWEKCPKTTGASPP